MSNLNYELTASNKQLISTINLTSSKGKAGVQIEWCGMDNVTLKLLNVSIV